VKTIHRSSAARIVAPLAALALACQLASDGKRESRSTSADRPPTAPLPAPPPAEPVRVAENTAAASLSEASARAPIPCAAAEFKYPAVQAACAEDGRRAVKKLMTSAIAKAKREGTELECGSCHLDQKTFGLRPNAVDDLARWL
jgi:hypothetical protein